MSVQVWRYDDPTVPAPFKQVCYRGGDEDWIVAGPIDDAQAFETVSDALNRHWGQGNVNENEVSEVPHMGQTYYVHVVCHA